MLFINSNTNAQHHRIPLNITLVTTNTATIKKKKIPYLKILVQPDYYNGATTYFSAKYIIWKDVHLFIENSLSKENPAKYK